MKTCTYDNPATMTRECWADGSGPRRSYCDSGRGTFCRDIPRDSELLVQVVEELGDEANGKFASLKVVTIPDDVEWEIHEYDGREWVAEKHRTWS